MRTRRLGLLAAVAIAALLAGACTGDGDVEVLVDEGDDPSVMLGDAIDRTVTASGRVTQTIEWHFEDLWSMYAPAGSSEADLYDLGNEHAGRMEFAIEGEFDGDDRQMDLRTVFGAETDEYTWLVVDGVEYRTAAPSDGIELDGRTWIELPDRERLDTISAAAGSDLFAAMQQPGDLVGSLEQLRELSGLVELTAGEIDGVPHRRVVGRLDVWGTSETLEAGFGTQLDPDERVRWERIEAYRAEHLPTEVEVWIDGDGLVRRLVTSTSDEVESEYRECRFLLPVGMSSQVDLFDLGEQMDITAPDPADVMPAEEYEQLTEFDGYVEDVATTTIVGGAWDQDDPDGMTPDGGVSDLEPGSVSWDTDMFAGCPA